MFGKAFAQEGRGYFLGNNGTMQGVHITEGIRPWFGGCTVLNMYEYT